MVCIAAFIILLIIGVFVAFISIFKPKVGKKYLKTLKKSWSCFGKRVTLQKCETGFGDDIKNDILAKVAARKPKFVKPLSITIEVASILIVIVAAWSLVEGIKAGLALWTLGTCNVKHASSCTLGAEVCSIDDNTEPQNPIEYIGLWFSDWGEIFGAMPDKFRSWDTSNFDFAGITINHDEGDYYAIDIFDPGCSVCLSSFRTQYETGFFKDHKVQLVPFPIQDESGNLKFKNSEMIVRYMYASYKYGEPRDAKDGADSVAFQIIKRIYTEKNADGDNWQSIFNDVYSNEETEVELTAWLKEFGYHTDERNAIKELAKSDETSQLIQKNNNIVVNDIHAKGIPTMIYDGHKHTGKYEVE